MGSTRSGRGDSVVKRSSLVARLRVLENIVDL